MALVSTHQSHEQLERKMAPWREKLDTFYLDKKYLSDIQQFTILSNVQVDDSLRYSEKEVTKHPLPPSVYPDMKNAFCQLYPDFECKNHNSQQDNDSVELFMP